MCALRHISHRVPQLHRTFHIAVCCCCCCCCDGCLSLARSRLRHGPPRDCVTRCAASAMSCDHSRMPCASRLRFNLINGRCLVLVLFSCVLITTLLASLLLSPPHLLFSALTHSIHRTHTSAMS